MTAMSSLIDLVVRLGGELDFDVARGDGVDADVVWFDRCLPLAAVREVFPDLRLAPVLPVAAFDVRSAADLETGGPDASVARLEATGAPLRVIVIGRPEAHSALAPALQSVDQLARQQDDAALRVRIADALRASPTAHGRTIVMLKQELVAWARRLRDTRPRSYSAESLFDRAGVID